MSRNVTATERNALEALIDKTSLHQVLNAIAGICTDKGDHLRTNWQSLESAKVWERHGRLIEQRADVVRLDGI